jgi:hypothetical protein
MRQGVNRARNVTAAQLTQMRGQGFAVLTAGSEFFLQT